MAVPWPAPARRVKPMSRYDCTQCGACCCNPPANRAEGFVEYIEVDDRAPLLQKPELVRRLVVVSDDGAAHMRLDPEGRCLALRGKLGKHVRCTIYADRPLACRKVEAASELCRRYRAARGLRP
ncbi:MAG: YkgJ family cysteine cluster protein [Myxococcales bacterium]|nr:YkgJ family cysteine cluster protein [Myxococcales bacterium]